MIGHAVGGSQSIREVVLTGSTLSTEGLLLLYRYKRPEVSVQGLDDMFYRSRLHIYNPEDNMF